MADTKISALPAASTPLAGTEVLPIVQGGVTEQVSVDNLTAGRAVAASGLTLTGATTAISLTLANSGGGTNATFAVTENTGITLNLNEGATARQLIIQQGGVETWRLNASGNLAAADGKGIDFSATSGSGTSELLADYETGIWTPTLLTSSTNFTSVTYDVATGGRYTKIGNVVHIQGYIRTDAVTVGSASGDVLIGGLPFTSVANSGSPVDGNSSLAISRVSDWAVNQPSAARVNANSTRIELYTRLSANGASSNMAVADVATGTDDNTIYFAGTYVAA